jgi:NADH-quinone oxidoreductase subunit N
MPPDAPRFAELQSQLAIDLLRLAPELVLCGAIVLMLFARLFRAGAAVHMATVGLIAGAAGIALLVIQWLGFTSLIPGGAGFDGLLQFDAFGCYLRTLILTAAMLVLILGRVTGLPDREDSADYTVLLLGATLGMMLMASANHLLAVFLAVEMASLPSYVLSGFLKGRPKASEAALKYVVFGAAASGVMLFGISLLVGRTGSALVPDVARGVALIVKDGGFDLPLLAGLLFTFVGLAFKLSAVPVHLWLPDAFEGAAAEVAAFLSVASKAAAVGLTARLLLSLQDQALAVGLPETTMPGTVGLVVLVAAALTSTVGNLAALPQTNVKRLLAYSTVAHAGYLMMALVPMSKAGVVAVLVYLTAYLFMNLGAFAVVAFNRNRTGSEDVSSLSGLLTRSPALGVALAVFLFGLLGVPPLAGFAGKFLAFAAVYDAGQTYADTAPALGTWHYALLGVGVVNTALSAGYYLRLVRVMSLDEPTDATPLGEPRSARLYVGVLAVAVLVMGVWWSPVLELARKAVGP